MGVETYGVSPREAEVTGLPILVGVGFTQQLFKLIVADSAAAL